MTDQHETDVSSVPPRRGTRRALVSWALYDWANSAHPTVILTFVFAAYFTRQVAPDEATGSTVWGTAIGVSGVFVALLGPLFGAATDQTGRRKRWLAASTVLCIVSSAALWFIKPEPSYMYVGVALAAVSALGMELAAIFYNAMLPGLAPRNQVGRWSGWGWGLGYAGGLACLVVSLYGFVDQETTPFSFDRESSQHVRATFLLVAVWYAVFALPIFLFTPDTRGTGKSIRKGVTDGGRQLLDSFREARRYADILRFLIARLFYTDGMATLFAFGGVYAAGTFDMTEEQVLQFGIALNVTAGLGAAGFSWIDDWIGSRRTIILSLVGLIVPGLAILFVESQMWFWIGGLVLGIFVGPVQAASRSYLARATPPELENQMFGLYAFSGKATAFLGPLMVGWLTYWTGSQRIGMSTIIAVWVIGLAIIWTLPEAAKAAQEPKHGRG